MFPPRWQYTTTALLILFSSSTPTTLPHCKLLHVDEIRIHPASATNPITLNLPLSQSSVSDTDISQLIDPGNPSRLLEGTYFSLQFRSTDETFSPSTATFDFSYTQDNGNDPPGISIDSSNYAVVSDTTTGSNYREVHVSIPDSAYNGSPNFYSMSHLSITIRSTQAFPTAGAGELKLQLLTICHNLPSPNYCKNPTMTPFQSSCENCNCQLCHNCGCTTKRLWQACGYGECDHNGCWCSPVCDCCSDCSAITCNCQTCCSESSFDHCSDGGSFVVSSITPQSAVSSETSTIILMGEGFANTASMKCTIGAEEVPAQFISSTQMSCVAPAKNVAVGGEEAVEVRLSLDGGASYSTANDETTFTYYHCEGGCLLGGCEAETCRCPSSTWGPSCEKSCECRHGSSCSTLDGSCACTSEFVGTKCELRCPGTETCSGNGACHVDTNDAAKAACTCFDGFYGSDCGNVCPKSSSGDVCNARGKCKTDGVCDCDEGFAGAICADKYCFNNCNGHGSCASGSCQCNLGYSGISCDLEGVDGISYLTFETSITRTAEGDGIASVRVSRIGDPEGEVSVSYVTSDLTANVVEDYVFTSGQLTWDSGDKESKKVDIKIQDNDEASEGEESFNLILSNPMPEEKSRLGMISKALIIIASKPESVVGGTARITIRVNKRVDNQSEEGEEMKTVLLKNVGLGVHIDHTRFYLPSNSIKQAIDDNEGSGSLVTFDIMPDNKSLTSLGSLDAANAFVKLVADESSLLYNNEMKENCPIDISYPPDIKMIFGDQIGGNIGPAAVITLIVLLIVAIFGGIFCWKHRLEIREKLLTKVSGNYFFCFEPNSSPLLLTARRYTHLVYFHPVLPKSSPPKVGPNEVPGPKGRGRK
mgnify:FL=1